MAPRTSFARRHPFLLSAAALLILCIAAWFTIDKWCERLLQAAMQPAIAAHEPITMAEVDALLPTIAAADDMTPVLLAEQEAMRKSKSTPEIKAIEPSTPIVSISGGRDNPFEIGAPFSADQLSAARKYIAAIRTSLSRIEKASRTGKGRYPFSHSALPMIEMKAYASEHRDMVKSLCLYAALESNDGHSAEAATALLACLRTDAPLNSERDIFGALIRAGSVAIACFWSCDSISRCGLSEPDLAAIQAKLHDIEQTWHLRDILLGERAAAMETISGVYSGLGNLPKVIVLRLLPGLHFVDRKRLWVIETHLCEAAGLQPSRAIAAARQCESDKLTAPSYCVVTRIMVPSLTRAFQLWFRTLGVLRSTQAALAAERYRLKTGHWPAALADLVPAYLDAVPTDPFDDKPLRYIQDSRGIRIYSIGEDNKDDGGEIDGYTKLKHAADYGAFLVNPDLRGKLTAVSSPSGK